MGLGVFSILVDAEKLSRSTDLSTHNSINFKDKSKTKLSQNRPFFRDGFVSRRILKRDTSVMAGQY